MDTLQTFMVSMIVPRTSIKFPMTGIVLSGFTAEKAKVLCTFACHVIAASFQVDDGVTLRTVLEVRMERRHAEFRPRAPKPYA